MIEGAKTTAANLFLTNIFFSSKYHVICLTSEFAILQRPSMATKRDLTRKVIYTVMQFFFCSKEWQQWQGKLQPLEDETGYKEAKMKAVGSTSWN